MVKYVVQAYQRYPIYEPAEGGYYYEGLSPCDNYNAFDTKEEAMQELVRTVDHENIGLDENDEGYAWISTDGLWACTMNHKYIGEGMDFYVEPINRRGRHRRGYVPYE